MTLQQEINALTSKRNSDKKAHTVENNWPKLKRTFAYRKSPAINAVDLAL